MKIRIFVFILVSLIWLVFNDLHQTNVLEITRTKRKYLKAVSHDSNKGNFSNGGHQFGIRRRNRPLSFGSRHQRRGEIRPGISASESKGLHAFILNSKKV